MIQIARVGGQSSFMGTSAAFQARPVTLGQFDWIVPLVTGILQAAPAAVSAYGAKRAADKAKKAKEDAQKQQAAAEAADAAAAAAKAASDQAAKEQLMAEQGLGPDGKPLTNAPGTILGVDPLVLGVGSLAVVGLGAALWMALGK